MGRRRKKAKTRNYLFNVEDHLSQLPDEIISNIFSRLELKELVRTSVLSRRLEKLWLLTSRCSGPNLRFSHTNPLYFCSARGNLLLFAELVNKVLKFHPQPLADELVINCYLDSTFSNVIDDWVKFAFSKGVKLLKLNLSFLAIPNELETPYAFPSLPKLLSTLPNNEHFRAFGTQRLRSLVLAYVYIDQQVVDALLSTCPLLECLFLEPYKLCNLKISGDTLKLKHLKLLRLDCAKRIEISAPYLVSLGYEGSMSALHLKFIPCLSELYVADTDWHPFVMRIEPHLSYISQLKKLMLRMSRKMVEYCTSFPLAFPQLGKLEQLEVDIEGNEGQTILWPTVFIKASPLLHSCKIRLVGFSPLIRGRLHSEIERRRIKEGTKCAAKFLKVVEVKMFRGSSSEIELVQHLFDIAAQSLEKVVFDTITGNESNKKLARSVAQGLDSRVQLVVL